MSAAFRWGGDTARPMRDDRRSFTIAAGLGALAVVAISALAVAAGEWWVLPLTLVPYLLVVGVQATPSRWGRR